jgi:hypothetical protein
VLKNEIQRHTETKQAYSENSVGLCMVGADVLVVTKQVYSENSVGLLTVLIYFGDIYLPFDAKKGELPRLTCFHNGIILIVNCF